MNQKDMEFLKHFQIEPYEDFETKLILPSLRCDDSGHDNEELRVDNVDFWALEPIVQKAFEHWVNLHDE